VVVVGGGISGLVAALELAERAPELDVVVVEAAPQLGGVITTRAVGGRTTDVGPDSLAWRRPEASALIKRLGLEDALVEPGATKALVLAAGRLRALPEGSVLGVPTRLGPLVRARVLDARGLARAALDALRPPASRLPRGASSDEELDRSVGAVVRRALGDQVAERLVDPVVGGIYAGRIDRLSAAVTFPQLLDAATRGGSLMRALRPATTRHERALVGLRGGMAQVPKALDTALRAAGGRIELGRRVRSLQASASSWTIELEGGGASAPLSRLVTDAIVLAVPAFEAARLLGHVAPSLAAALASIRVASVATVTFALAPRRASLLERSGPASGFLVARGSGQLLTACTFLDAKWPEQTHGSPVLVRASVGYDGDERHQALDDDELVARVRCELEAALGRLGEPLDAVVARYPRAFPQYEPGHRALASSLRQAAAALRPPLALAGSYLDGIGIPVCAGAAEQAARDLLAGLVGRP
jgi:oxygen-dependent protoporphyrinogen oxidase